MPALNKHGRRSARGPARRGHANLLCIAPILTDDPRRGSSGPSSLRSLVFFRERADTHAAEFPSQVPSQLPSLTLRPQYITHNTIQPSQCSRTSPPPWNRKASESNGPSWRCCTSGRCFVWWSCLYFVYWVLLLSLLTFVILILLVSLVYVLCYVFVIYIVHLYAICSACLVA